MTPPTPDWVAVDPSALGVTNALFLLRRDGLPDAYAPTITVSGGWQPAPVSLEDVADETLAKLRREGAYDVALLDRDAAASALEQTLALTIEVEGRTHLLRQVQAVRAYADPGNPGRAAVLLHTLSCTVDQAPAMTAELETYLASVEVDAGL